MQAGSPVETVSTVKNADIGNVTFAAVWNGTGEGTPKALVPVNLTDASNGKAMMYNGSALVEDTRPAVKKYETVKLTFNDSESKGAQVPGWYPVSVNALAADISSTKYDCLRVASTLTGTTYVASYTYTEHVGALVSLGYIHVAANTGTITYHSQKSNDAQYDLTEFTFYYSISPMSTAAANDSIDNAANSYGTLQATIGTREADPS